MLLFLVYLTQPFQTTPLLTHRASAGLDWVSLKQILLFSVTLSLRLSQESKCTSLVASEEEGVNKTFKVSPLIYLDQETCLLQKGFSNLLVQFWKIHNTSFLYTTAQVGVTYQYVFMISSFSCCASAFAIFSEFHVY